jgi:hypothetical protein
MNKATHMHHSFSHHIFLPSSLSHLPTLLFLPPLVHLLFLSWPILSTPRSLDFKHYGSKPLAVPKGVFKIKTSWKFYPSAPDNFLISVRISVLLHTLRIISDNCRKLFLSMISATIRLIFLNAYCRMECQHSLVVQITRQKINFRMVLLLLLRFLGKFPKRCRNISMRKFTRQAVYAPSNYLEICPSFVSG